MASAFVVYSIANSPGESVNASRTQFLWVAGNHLPIHRRGHNTQQEDYQLKGATAAALGSTGLKV